jgi:HEAT repeat protein
LGLGLGELEDPGAIETMTNALGDRDTVVRAMAAWALDRLEGIAAIAPLGKALSDDPSPVRRRAAWAARERSSTKPRSRSAAQPSGSVSSKTPPA